MTPEEKVKLAQDNAGIDTATVKQDIADTEAEIVIMTREEAGYRLIGDRLSVMKADYRKDGIKDREKFITMLKTILEMRGE